MFAVLVCRAAQFGQNIVIIYKYDYIINLYDDDDYSHIDM